MTEFLSLPAEIRENIYIHLFQDTALCFLKSTTDTETEAFICRSMRDIHLPRLRLLNAARNTPNILLTCRMCYDEAHLIFVSTATLVVFHQNDLRPPHLNSASAMTVSNLRTIQNHSWDFPLLPLDPFRKLRFPALKTFDAGKFWFTRLGWSPQMPQLLHNAQNKPSVDKKVIRLTASLELGHIIDHVTQIPDLTCNYFLTIVCIAMYPRSRKGSHCDQCHGYMLHYWTMLVNTKKVFRCFGTTLDTRVARAVLLGHMTPEETGLLEPQPRPCLYESGVHPRRRSRVFIQDHVADMEILHSAKLM